jgi:hypothetical protein
MKKGEFLKWPTNPSTPQKLDQGPWSEWPRVTRQANRETGVKRPGPCPFHAGHTSKSSAHPPTNRHADLLLVTVVIVGALGSQTHSCTLEWSPRTLHALHYHPLGRGKKKSQGR